VNLHFTFADWAFAFVLTIAVELPVCWLVLRSQGATTVRLLWVAAICSVLTHPLLWYVLPDFFDRYTTFIVVSELAVTLLEALVLWRLVPTKNLSFALLAAAAMNAASVAIGLLLM